jgi:hypothetical protein
MLQERRDARGGRGIERRSPIAVRGAEEQADSSAA